MKHPYEDIIDLPRPVSARHPRMPMANRAAQFSPFAALAGYEDAVQETARPTDGRVELSEEKKAALDQELRLLAEGAESAVFICFLPDGKKEGGAYLAVTGTVKKFDNYAREIVLGDGRRMPIDDILELQSEALGN